MQNYFNNYLQVSLGLATATALSKMVDNDVLPDQVTRMLSNNDVNSKTLWQNVKSLVRQHGHIHGYLIFDDSIFHKPYIDENNIVC